MGVLLATAFYIFTVKVKRLYRIMQSADGASPAKPDRIAERIGVLVKDVLGQRNVRRKKMAGWAHALIFFGFMVVQPHSLELMIRGIIPGFSVGHLFPGVYNFYLFIADILGFLVLAGFGYAAYRRFMKKLIYLTMGKDANFIILFTCVIIITFHLINACQIVSPYATQGYDYANVFPISGLVASIFGLDSLTAASQTALFEVFYWVHMLTIMGFLVYIPGSKHLHLLAAAPNVFLKPLDREKGFCCGAGGARMFMEETLGTYINVERAKEIEASGADIVASACPHCITMLRDGLKECGSDIRVQDIAELLFQQATNDAAGKKSYRELKN